MFTDFGWVDWIEMFSLASKAGNVGNCLRNINITTDGQGSTEFSSGEWFGEGEGVKCINSIT